MSTPFSKEVIGRIAEISAEKSAEISFVNVMAMHKEKRGIGKTFSPPLNFLFLY
jgi:hypothetical protein